MSRYPHGRQLVTDARLRLERLGEHAAILMVEGPDDKRVFGDHSWRRQQIVVSGGRRLLLDAYDALEAEDADRIVFVTDCDYEVAAGALSGSRNLIITQRADVDSDLVQLGTLRRVVAQLIPHANESDELLDNTTAGLIRRGLAMAEPLGRIRKVARLNGCVFDLEDLRFGRLRDPHSDTVDDERVAEVVVQRTHHCAMSKSQLVDAMGAVSGGEDVCNGHDLLAAVSAVLHQDFRVATAAAGSLAALVRVALDGEMFEQWSVVRRIRSWERATGRVVLLPAEKAS